MVTKRRELTKDELLRSFSGLADDSTVGDFIEHLASLIGLERKAADEETEPRIAALTDRMKKDRLMQSLGRLPDDANVDDFAYRLYVILKIEKGMAASQAGNKVTQEEARERLKRWLR